MVNGSKPLRLVKFGILGILRGVMFLTLSDIALICFGVVPQQPPTRLT